MRKEKDVIKTSGLGSLWDKYTTETKRRPEDSQHTDIYQHCQFFHSCGSRREKGGIENLKIGKLFQGGCFKVAQFRVGVIFVLSRIPVKVTTYNTKLDKMTTFLVVKFEDKCNEVIREFWFRHCGPCIGLHCL